MDTDFGALRAEIARIGGERSLGRVRAIGRGTFEVRGLSREAVLGDIVEVRRRDGRLLRGEVLQITPECLVAMPDGPDEGIAISDQVRLVGPAVIAPDDSWLGRVVDPLGVPLDGRPIRRGAEFRPLNASPPPAADRRLLGDRLETGIATFNTILPLVRGQRLGLFAGSGVGKSSLLARLAQGVEADVVVLALIGERGRELRAFTEKALGPEGMARSVVVAATSDRSALERRRAAWSAMSVAEHFRDQGANVLFLADSITRFAEAHREIALAAGEAASLRGFPPSMSHMITSLAERSGPGTDECGDITAVFTVLVAGSDMEEPVADTLRGTLDGHVVLDRTIAERGRFPAVDALRSVSRSLPDAATKEENALIARTRQLLGAYERAELMVQSGLYASGSDPLVDAALKAWPALDAFLGLDEKISVPESFERLKACLDRAGGSPATTAPPASAAPADAGQ